MPPGGTRFPSPASGARFRAGLRKSKLGGTLRGESVKRHDLFLALLVWMAAGVCQAAGDLRLAGVAVAPHLQSEELRYRQPTDRSLGARVQLFLRNSGASSVTISDRTAVLVRDRAPGEWLASDEWAWHDFPSAWPGSSLEVPAGAMTVWSFNGKRAPWGVGRTAEMAVGESKFSFQIQDPQVWLSSITFLGRGGSVTPDSLIFHAANRGRSAVRLDSMRLWLPKTNMEHRVLHPQAWVTDFQAFPVDRRIRPGERGGAVVQTGPLPLSPIAVEVRLADAEGGSFSIWAHLRVKREVFDISGGWVDSVVDGRSTLTQEAFLKTLARMHVNTAHIENVPGYTDNLELYSRFPLKYFHRLHPPEKFETPEILPRIHAVEFLGEPQYGGGRPVAPMEVWRALAPYQSSRLPTTVTHSEERIWRFYSGLSDYPHYDAYRVSAPSPDAWGLYDRWGGEKIRWGAPLETIGDMTRSLRELNRPAPIAYWSQGAHDGWGRYGGRARTSPTPEELRAQAYHGLSSRITSLYWFNLSLGSLLKFPDLIQPIAEIGREIRMLEKYYIEGDAFHHERLAANGSPSWDLAVISGPNGALLFALDLAYSPDPKERVFKFAPKRADELSWPLPAYLGGASILARVSGSAVEEIPHKRDGNRISVKGAFQPATVFLLTSKQDEIQGVENRRRELMQREEAIGFDPAGRPEHLAELRAIMGRQ